MSHKHKVKIEKLFEHPISGNIEVKKLLTALEHYGASVDMTKQNKAKIFFKEGEFILPMTHSHMLSKDSVTHLRHFLEKVGVVPGKIE